MNYFTLSGLVMLFAAAVAAFLTLTGTNVIFRGSEAIVAAIMVIGAVISFGFSDIVPHFPKPNCRSGKVG